ncbi:MAG: hypothetical protein ACJ76H_14700 [Bacteriovoracaceae bacterium]
MMIKLYVLLFHFFMGTFLSGGFLIAMSSFFKVSWSQKLRDLAPLWKKLAPFMVVLFIPLIIWARTLVPITHEQEHKALYFSLWFVILRSALLSGAIIYGARVLLTKPVIAMVFYFFTGTFVAIDWGMSLEYHWTSNIYGLIYLVNFSLVFFAGMLFFRTKDSTEAERKDLIHVLVTLVIMWGYLHYAQFIILWMGNKPSEVKFYLVRNYPFGIMTAILLVKLVPVLGIAFFPKKKSQVEVHRILCALVVCGGWLELNWLLVPPLMIGHLTALAGSGLLIAVAGAGLGAMVRRWA